MIRISFVSSAILFLVGCSQTIASQTPGVAMPSPSKTALVTGTQTITSSPSHGDNTQTNSFLPMLSASSLEALIEKAREDLAQRLSIPAGDISLVEAKAVVWPDGSLGCPQPGMMYAQVLTPGYLIKLKYDNRDFEYHAGKDGSLAYCKSPLPPVEGAPDNT